MLARNIQDRMGQLELPLNLCSLENWTIPLSEVASGDFE